MTGYAELALVRGLDYLATAQTSIANNLANVSTTAYKRRQAVAESTGTEFQSLLGIEMPSVVYRERVDQSAGIAKPTGETLNISIGGGDFFKVQNATGQSFFTKNGELVIDSTGYLATRSGMRYVDAGGAPIQVGGATELAIHNNGLITGQSQGGEETGPVEFGALATFRVPDARQLQAAGPGLYSDPSDQLVTLNRNPSVRQGFLEQSNVQALDELVHMISVQRKFQATTKALTSVGRIQQSYIASMNR